MSQNQITPTDKSECRFIPQGESDPIALSFSIVKKNFCMPTKSGVMPTDQDVTAFLMTCRSQKLNPFLGDAWLIGYDSQGVAKFSVLVSQRVLLKRAEMNEKFDGLESGITVEDEAGNITDLNSEIVPKGRELVGGWCRVYRKDWGRQVYKQIPLDGYRKDTRFWKENPAGMIVKCAESDALRFAFPSVNGGLRTVEEGAVVDIGSITSQVRIQAAEPNATPALQVVSATAEAGGDKSPQDELADIVTGSGFTLDHLLKWGAESGNIPESDTIDSFAGISATICKRLIKSKAGLLQGLAVVKGGAN